MEYPDSHVSPCALCFRLQAVNTGVSWLLQRPDQRCNSIQQPLVGSAPSQLQRLSSGRGAHAFPAQAPGGARNRAGLQPRCLHQPHWHHHRCRFASLLPLSRYRVVLGGGPNGKPDLYLRTATAVQQLPARCAPVTCMCKEGREARSEAATAWGCSVHRQQMEAILNSEP